ncbi:hypothetical protein [Nostoc sp. T09]|uniref:hypothetical protein n=1 Tax=Nostoc sp. T09 TaxID=1932621 RepID=UPI001C4E5F52|nr:hypothetical protein [Nostoc sp. T09]
MKQTDYRNLNPGNITNIHTIYNDYIWFAHSYINQPFKNSKNQNKYENNGIERTKIIYWNGFGFSKDNKKIIVETNIVCDGTGSRYGGLFAKDANSDKFLLHTGNVNKKKDSLQNWYKCNFPKHWVNVRSQQNSQPKKAILVTALQLPKLIENIMFFMNQVDYIKSQ